MSTYYESRPLRMSKGPIKAYIASELAHRVDRLRQ